MMLLLIFLFFFLVNLKGLSLLPVVRFDQNIGCRLLPETCVSHSGSERELHSTLQPPATHPLQEQLGHLGQVERQWTSRASEKINRVILSPVTQAFCHQEIHKLTDGGRLLHSSWRSREGSAKTAQWRPRWWHGASWPWPSPQRLQTRGEAEATLLRETEEMYVRALSHINQHVAWWKTTLSDTTFPCFCNCFICVWLNEQGDCKQYVFF